MTIENWSRILNDGDIPTADHWPICLAAALDCVSKKYSVSLEGYRLNGAVFNNPAQTYADRVHLFNSLLEQVKGGSVRDCFHSVSELRDFEALLERVLEEQRRILVYTGPDHSHIVGLRYLEWGRWAMVGAQTPLAVSIGYLPDRIFGVMSPGIAPSTRERMNNVVLLEPEIQL